MKIKSSSALFSLFISSQGARVSRPAASYNMAKRSDSSIALGRGFGVHLGGIQ